MTYERVHTIWDYYDGPRSGIADYAGIPHYYLSEFDDAKEEYTDTFLLRKIDDATFQLILKQWKIWRIWELAFHSGLCDKTSHPALPGQDEAYAQLGIEIRSEIDTLATDPVAVSAVFRALPDQTELPKGVSRELQVEWTLCR